MNPYHFSDLFAPHSYPSIYTPHYIRFALLLQNYNFTEKENKIRTLELFSDQNEWQLIHQQSLSHYDCISLEDFFQNKIQNESLEKNPYDIIILNVDWSRLTKQKKLFLLNSLAGILKINGFVCFRYSVMPGCAPLVALRDLMLIQMNPNASSEDRKMQGLQALYFTDNYSKTASKFFERIPKAKECLEDIKKTPFDQLEKDWLDPNWSPIFSSDLSEKLEKENYHFVSSLSLPLQLDMCLPSDVSKLLQEENDVILRETIRDFGLNQLMRIDLFTRQTALEITNVIDDAINHIPFCLSRPRATISCIQIPAPNGDLIFDDTFYFTFLDALADENYRPKTITELKQHALLQNLDSSLFVAILNILVASGVVYPTNMHITPSNYDQCAKYNLALLDTIKTTPITPVLASPILGSGLSLSRIYLLFLFAYTKESRTEKDLAQFVFNLLKENNEHLLDSDGNKLPDDKALNLLIEQAQNFTTTLLPFLLAIKILPLN